MATTVMEKKPSLLARTAIVIYLAAHDTERQVPPAFESLSYPDRCRYERMAAAALTEALREPVDQ